MAIRAPDGANKEWIRECACVSVCVRPGCVWLLRISRDGGSVELSLPGPPGEEEERIII